MKHDDSPPGSLLWDQPAAPFSFLLNGTSSDTLLPSWNVAEEAAAAEGGALRRLSYTDPVSNLVVSAEIRSFDAFPAVEWVVHLENRGDAPTPIIEDILPLDMCIPAATPIDSQAHVDLHYARGSTCVLDDFLPLHARIGGRRHEPSFGLSPKGGRSSDGVLPFMNLQTSDGGLVLAIGWTGQWQARFVSGCETVHVAAGMEQTHLRLLPGERIRTPRILLIEWEGDDPIVGNNLLRQLILAHYTPRLDGKRVIPPIAHNTMYAHWLDKSSLSLEGERKAVAKGHDIGVEAHWVDACWFGTGDWHAEVGDWRIRREVFPDGLRPLGDTIHDNGMQFILWFEPERVCRETPLAQKHPDWMLDHEGAWCFLLNLGNAEARAHIIEIISGYIDEFGVDVYRQDFNMPPLPFWQAADAPDRAGIAEIRYVEGLYAFWDELRHRHPNLTIDNCASGGRRIDLETTARSYPLWRSDFSDVSCLSLDPPLKHIGAQCQTAGLSRWVPLHAAAVWSFDPYEFRSAMSSGVVPYCDIRTDDFPDELARKAIAELKRLRPYFLGDFYPLLTLTAALDQWCAYQYHRPDLDAGFALFLRRHESPITTLAKPGLRGIDPAASYAVGLAATSDDPPRRTMSGQELLDLTITIPEQPGSLLLVYAKEGHSS
jgi:alpha-galactosidase